MFTAVASACCPEETFRLVSTILSRIHCVPLASGPSIHFSSFPFLNTAWPLICIEVPAFVCSRLDFFCPSFTFPIMRTPVIEKPPPPVSSLMSSNTFTLGVSPQTLAVFSVFLSNPMEGTLSWGSNTLRMDAASVSLDTNTVVFRRSSWDRSKISNMSLMPLSASDSPITRSCVWAKNSCRVACLEARRSAPNTVRSLDV
ncbi:hypothetical protein D3C75_686460 [compost metagenome]